LFEYENDERSIVVASEHVIPTIDQQIQIWLSSVSPSGSPRTVDGYSRTMTHFREFLAEYNLDLDSDESVVATCAEAWAAKIQLPPANHMTYPSVLSRARKLKNGELSPTTYNDRLTVVASFYKFAKRRRWQSSNPIEMCMRKVVGAQNYAKPIPMDKVAKVLAGIDRTTRVFGKV
jgi:site-specific recombinase XerD